MSAPRSIPRLSSLLSSDESETGSSAHAPKVMHVEVGSRGSIHGVHAIVPHVSSAPPSSTSSLSSSSSSLPSMPLMPPAAPLPSWSEPPHQATLVVMPTDAALARRTGRDGPSRRDISLEASIETPEGRRYAFETINVSMRGLFVSGDPNTIPLKLGSPHTVRLRADGRTATFQAQLVHAVAPRDATPNRPAGFGFRIMIIARDQQTELERMLAEAPVSRLPEVPPPSDPWKRLALFAFVALGALGVVAGVVAVLGPRGPRVETAIARQAQIDEVVASAPGEVVPRRFMTLRSPLPTPASFEVVTRSGAQVSAGDLLARVVERDAETAKSQLNAKVAAAEANVARVRARVADGESDPARLSQAEGALRNARAELAERDRRERRGEVRAPFAGYVAGVEAQSGDFVPPNGPLLELVDASSLHASAAFGEADAVKIKVGMHAKVITPGAELEGTVDGLGVVVRSFGAGKAVLVEIALPPDAGVRPGATAKASVITGRRSAVIVPSDALVAAPQGAPHDARLVWQTNGTTASPRIVTVGAEINGETEVVGLDSGAEIVRKPPPTLQPGARIRR